ncbi:hypothetical protein CI109_106550 [Kwoniella shandongensis]|uniref:Structure-specific endonuclease subunit SLX4 n=1 Tax=Kwoniella shandongensis TaxID=1734106 RepID=A0A5M6C1W5_9TREE|nr:uncharacterized protein CI109_002730 [Kwoniella shandongensis]KAA5528973.1 hypothetical protein CI109_002730 [Kwoniella shandongensis]
MSITPRADTSLRRRRAPSATPTPTPLPVAGPALASMPIEIVSSSPSDEEADEWVNQNWGDDAVMSWEGGKIGDEEDNGSVSSVAADEAGVDEEEWGREAYLQWGWQGEGEGGYLTVTSGDSEEEEERETIEIQSDHDDDVDEEEEGDQETVEIRSHDGGEEEEEKATLTIESKEQLVGRGMPDYTSWELKKLQKLVTSYGFRTSNDHKSLEKIAVDCWRAIYPPAPVPSIPALFTSKSERPKAKSKTVRTRESSTTSISSAEMPLANIKKKGRKAVSVAKAKEPDYEVVGSSGKVPKSTIETPKGKAIGKGKKKAIQPEEETGVQIEEEVEIVDDLSSRFFDMIKNDKELYIRILRYEPISFDELISKGFAAGIDKLKRGWKKDLKRYLDLQSITYFTEDPTGQRRRH